MASELKHVDPGYTGSTLYAVLLDSSGQAYNGSTFEALTALNWATYDIALTEQASLGVFLGDMPAVAAGLYTVLIYDRAGGTPATTDEHIGTGSMDWSGTAERTLLTTAQVNAEVVDALNVDTFAEPGQGEPPATASLATKIGYLFKAWRNKSTQTATQYSLYNDAGDTIDQKAATSDDGTTFTRNKVGAGP